MKGIHFSLVPGTTELNTLGLTFTLNASFHFLELPGWLDSSPHQAQQPWHRFDVGPPDLPFSKPKRSQGLHGKVKEIKVLNAWIAALDQERDKWRNG